MSSSDKSPDYIGAFLEGLLAAKYNQANSFTLDGGNQLRSSNIAGIWAEDSDSDSKDWIVRVDKPHAGKVDFHHVNINKGVTGVPDPHIQISESTANAIGNICDTVKTARNFVDLATTAVEAYRLGRALYNDVNDGDGSMEETKKTAASMVGGYVGGKHGAEAGSAAGAKLGELIGMVGGPEGEVLGGAIGSMVGGVIGGVAGAQIGREMAEEAYNDKVPSSHRWNK